MRIVLGLTLLFISAVGFADGTESVFSKKPKSKWVLESENAFVLEDKYPQEPVHLLVVSKEVVPNINEAPEPLLGEMLDLARTAAEKYKINESGYRLVINTNKDGGQSVSHLHIHVLGGRQMQWPPG